MGISNQSIERFFISKNVYYDIALDDSFIFKDIKYDYLIKSPSIKMNDKLIITAKKLNISVISDIELFYLLFPNNFYVVVTGTNGKTSVVNYIHQLLNETFHYFVGNMGIPIFNISGERIENKIILLEASSYMLESTNNFKPNILIITNLEKHHLDHHTSKKDYFLSKTKCINQMNNGIVIFDKTYKCLKSYKRRKNNIFINVNFKKIFSNGYIDYGNNRLELSKLFKYSYFDKKNIIFSLITYYFISKHLNIINDDFIIFNKIETLVKYPYRFEIVKNNPLIINDSKSTNPYSGLAAVKEMNKLCNNYVLIIGGVYQKHNFKVLKKELLKVKCLYLYGENKKHLLKVIKKFHNRIKVYNTLEEIIGNIDNSSNILFSPMSASFDQFKNFEERGKYFNVLINKN